MHWDQSRQALWELKEIWAGVDEEMGVQCKSMVYFKGGEKRIRVSLHGSRRRRSK